MGPEGLLTLRGGCFLARSPPHPNPPRAPGPPGLGRRLGGVHDDGEADGKGPGRGPASVPGEGGREGGLQQVPPLEEEPRARLQLQWQQEAIPVHLLPPGWPAVTAGALPLSVPPRGGGGFSLEAGPKGPGWPCQALLPLLLWLAAWPQATPCRDCSVQSLFGSWWKGRSCLETPAFSPSCYSGR